MECHSTTRKRDPHPRQTQDRGLKYVQTEEPTPGGLYARVCVCVRGCVYVCVCECNTDIVIQSIVTMEDRTPRWRKLLYDLCAGCGYL